MRIKDIHVEGFGVWRDLQINNLADDMTVFYGPNEAGKTTLMQFIRSILYGFCGGSKDRYLPPVHGGNPGGALGISDDGRRYLVHRRAVLDQRGHEGRVTVTFAEGGAASRTVGELLSGVDESIFNNVFALGLREIQELNTLDGTEAAQQLYAMTNGIDRVSLMEVLGELEQARSKILDDTQAPSDVSNLLAQRERLRSRRDELLAQGRQWMDNAQRRGGAGESADVLERARTEAAAQSRVLETAIQLHPQWAECIKLDRAIEDDCERTHVSPRTLQRVDQLKEEILALRKKLGGVRRKRARLRKEARSIEFQSAILDNAERIEAALDEAQKIPAWEQQIQHLQAEIEEQESELRQRVTRQLESSLPGGAAALAGWKSSIQPVTARTLAAMRGPARAVRAAMAAARRAKDDLEKVQREAQRSSERLEKVLGPRAQHEFSTSMDDVSEQVGRVRRRIQIEDRLHQMIRRREEIEEDIVDLMEDDVMPFARLMWTGVPFVIGFTLLLSGLFWPEITPLGGFVSVLGMGGLLFGMLTKVMLERQAASELEDCNRQLAGLNHDIEELQGERDQLDRLLPKSGGPLDVRLRELETRLDQLQQLTPIESDFQLAEQRTIATRERLEEAIRERRIATRRWRAALKKQKLPETMKPSQVRELADGSQETLLSQQHLESRRADLEARQRELQALLQRLEQLVYDAQLPPASRDPKGQLKQLAAALGEQRKLQEKRAQTKREYDALKRNGMKLLKEVRKLRANLAHIYRDHQVEDEEQLRHAADHDQRMEDLRKKRDQVRKAIEDSIDDASLIAPVLQGLREATLAQLEQRWEQCQQREQEARGKLQALKDQQVEARDEIRGLVDDYRLVEAQFDLACIEEQLRQAVRQWRVLTVTQSLLQKIRDDYESERQPRTLADASQYLRRLTGGRYVRVWTPFGEPTLRIDDAHGDTVNVDVLSCGTREAVFVSLRLALAEEYARRGAVLPMILDDVLVNLDNRRVELAVEVLRDFSRSGHQILLFTCHDHVRELFREARVETRALPSRGDVEAPPLPPPAPLPVVAMESATVVDPVVIAADPQPNPRLEPRPKVVEIAASQEPIASVVVIEEYVEELDPQPVAQKRVVESELESELEDLDEFEEDFARDDEQPAHVEYVTEWVNGPPDEAVASRGESPPPSGDPYEFERISKARQSNGAYDSRQDFDERNRTSFWFDEGPAYAARAGRRERPVRTAQSIEDADSRPGVENWWAEDDSAMV